jgi:integrase
VLLATFADMRWGELAGLGETSIDLDTYEISITEVLSQPDKGGLRFDTPKSKELMARLGHSSVRAALIYQHDTRDRDKAMQESLAP